MNIKPFYLHESIILGTSYSKLSNESKLSYNLLPICKINYYFIYI